MGVFFTSLVAMESGLAANAGPVARVRLALRRTVFPEN
jgi:hypothetical protein